MPKHNQTEVLVVGAGPVGMMTALLAAQHGLRTAIIDLKSRTARHSYACALHPASLALLARAGLLPDVIKLGLRVETVALFDGGAIQTRLNLGDLPGEHPFAVVLPQFLLEELLEEKLRAAGVQVQWHRCLAHFEQDDQGVDAVIEKLAPSARDCSIPDSGAGARKTVKLHAGFLIGADGHNSFVRRQLGIPWLSAGEPQFFAVHEIATVEPLDREVKLLFNGAGLSALWPLSENKCRWSFQITASEAGRELVLHDHNGPIVVEPPNDHDTLDQLRRFLAERAPWFKATVNDILWVACAGFKPAVAGRFGQGRCWLAGDAAHQTGPAGMQSMNLGLGEAADLADKLKTILRDLGRMDGLQDYRLAHEAQWKRLLGLQIPAQPVTCSSPWATQHLPTLLASLPVSGHDLDLLLQKL
jgi:2-polyprenyl-6-methoxyphenol hydroxylase-like FAD-dependent oxidoreductase